MWEKLCVLSCHDASRPHLSPLLQYQGWTCSFQASFWSLWILNDCFCSGCFCGLQSSTEGLLIQAIWVEWRHIYMPTLWSDWGWWSQNIVHSVSLVAPTENTNRECCIGAGSIDSGLNPRWSQTFPGMNLSCCGHTGSTKTPNNKDDERLLSFRLYITLEQ